jgi:hypothetical protein
MNDSDIYTIKNVLTQVTDIDKKYQDIYQLTGANYNVFKIADINTKETTICKVIADLLNPKGSHYKADTYLKLFKEIVLKNSDFSNYCCLDTKDATASTEYPTNESRRIDIVIKSDKIFIPIEVKINADDLEKQISDYYEYCKKYKNEGKGIPVLYLTKDGDEPRKISASDKDKYRCISFSENILSWLGDCLKCPETIKTAPIREIIIQLIAVIKSFCGIPEDKNMKEEIMEILKSSEKNVKAAEFLCGSLQQMENMTIEPFENLIERLKSDGIGKGSNDEEFIISITNKKVILRIDRNWLWLGLWFLDDKEDGGMKEEYAKCRVKMNLLTGHENKPKDGALWRTDIGIEYLGLDRSDSKYINYYKIYKLYLEHSEKIFDKIKFMVKELEDA